MDIKKWVADHDTLYDPQFEHDNCGVGLVANIDGNKTHEIIERGLQVLLNLVHRGAVGGDDKTGDGAGLLSQIPHNFFVRELKKDNVKLPAEGQYGVGMLFLPQDEKKRSTIEEELSQICKNRGFKILHWRNVPFKSDCLGGFALSAMPIIKQIFVDNGSFEGDDFERQLYILRRIMENRAHELNIDFDEFYVCSLSSRTITYKGMFTADQMNAFYPDLHDPIYTSAMAIVHQRFSTNTFPSWPLAQPFRYLAHNGEINTLRGNINRMKGRESQMTSSLFGGDTKKLFPIIQAFGSDSACLDNAFELLANGGRSVEHSMMMLVPEAFGVKYHMSQDKRAFYEYHASIMEPWDGPAALVFSDGRKIGAILDRNGLRPARYVVTKDNFVVLASEVGVLEFPPEEVLYKGRLTPGKMFLVNLEEKRIVSDHEIKAKISRQKPYRRWLETNKIELRGLFDAPRLVEPDHTTIIRRQTNFGYTREDLTFILAPMALNGQEPVGSMGNDTPLAVLSDEPQLLFWYFKQLFAQVTNPAIDPYRESLVMSLMSFIGHEKNLLDETPEHCCQLKLSHPILSNDDMQKILNTSAKKCLKVTLIPITFDPSKGVAGLRAALETLKSTVEKKVDEGNTLIVLSDRTVDSTHAPIPSLLAVSTVHHYLTKVGKRLKVGLIVETGEARDVTHFALLIGYGASAINPYLAFETLSDMIKEGMLPSNIDQETAIDNYINALKKGLLKIFSKMGISTLRSYRGAMIFEAVGLSRELVDEYFPGTISRISGIGLETIAQEAIMRHRKAYPLAGVTPRLLELGGQYHYRHNTEHHLLTPTVIARLQHAVMKNDYKIYKEYAALINDQSRKMHTLRGLFSFRKNKPIKLSEVESVDSIVKRFSTGAMSYGSISKEAHESLAIAMNRLGGKSNTGEGGEEERRFLPLPNGDSANSAIKQVASGRFGVTITYLANSKELQIKIAQGAKPGEGGQLPGHKVNDIIAKTRHSTPGVTLISPPPHHDIYSIEDIAQLIHDLKNANPDARVSVKLVSEVGVGTIAAGVAKAKSDMVLISGYDGGTGASPVSSIKHAGIPWELGLAETQQTLVLNSLRDRIRVQVDGKLATGRDLAVAIMLGAEEFGFSTMPLIALGCIMMRKCHLNTCPVGIATQDADLRKRFFGKPEYVVNFMRFIAEELREIMAELGFKTVDEMVGRVDMMETNNALDHWKARGLDFSALLSDPTKDHNHPRRCMRGQDHELEKSLDQQIIPKCKNAIETKKAITLSFPIKNCNRTVGTQLSSLIAKTHGSKGLPDDTIHINFSGSAGQSFGAFLSKGVTFELAGDTNDYIGKGLSGGRLIVYPPKESSFESEKNIIIGNTVLYGATSGELYVSGVAGERFAVRNSGATAVIEGVGDHGCEYMTGGTVVVLGETGRNFAAGMSGGIAFVYDKSHLFDTLCNLDMVDIETVNDEEDIALLKRLIDTHASLTGSKHSKEIADNWEHTLPYFVKVMPIEYRRALQRLKEQLNRNDDTTTITEEVYR